MLSLRLLPLFLLCAIFQVTRASVLAIDYGSDWIKASLMKPGIPFDIMLNKDSKRKIQSSVGWKKKDRLFGGDAYNIAGRFPLDSFSSLKHILGHLATSPTAEYFTSISTTDSLATLRDTLSFRRSDGSEWSTEELIAMQLSYVKGVATDIANEPVTEAILTIPPYYTQFERDALADAVEIAGLRLLAFIQDGAAVAVNYAMTRTFADAKETHIIYDVGASGVRATVVEFSADTGKGKKGGVVVQVKGTGYEQYVAGTEIDRRTRDILVDAFNTKHAPHDITKDKRGMAKLWKEAGRVKAILSANTEAFSTVEDLAFNIDFRTKISRAQLEEACKDLKPKWTSPITAALEVAGLSLSDVKNVILMGGASRTPMIQAALKEVVSESKIAQNINTDEAAVLGAALHGAALSRQFKTKSITVNDISIHPVQLSYFAAPAADNARVRTITSTIFGKGSKLGTKKVVTFKRKEDFDVILSYIESPAEGFPTELLSAKITGVEEALANLTDLGAIDPVIKATISLSASGFVSVESAVAFTDSIKTEDKDSITDKLKGFFGSSKEEDTTNDSTPPTDTNDDQVVVEDHVEGEQKLSRKEKRDALKAAEKAFKAMTDKQKKEAASTKKETHQIKLNITTSFPSQLKPMTVADKKASRDRLREIDYEENAKQRRENARNSFEGYLYRLRDLIDDEDETKPFKKCSQDAERVAIRDKLAESMTWLHEEADSAETAQFYEKRNALETLERPIMHRYSEIAEFPHALNNSQLWNWSARVFLKDARTNLTADEEAGALSKYTTKDLDTLEATLIEHEIWLDEWVEKQKSVAFNEDPVIDTKEMKARAKTLENAVMKLLKRKTPKAPKKSAPSSSTTPSPEETSIPPVDDEIPPESSESSENSEKLEHDEL